MVAASCPDLSRRVQLRPGKIQPPQPMQHRTQLWRLAHLLTQRVGLGEGVPTSGAASPFAICSAAPRAMWRVKACWVCSGVWQGLQQLNPVAVQWLIASPHWPSGHWLVGPPAASKESPARGSPPRCSAGRPARVVSRRSPGTVPLTPGQCADGAAGGYSATTTDTPRPG